MSLAALDNKDAACTVWGELGSKFPQASPSVVARARLERQKALLADQPTVRGRR